MKHTNMEFILLLPLIFHIGATNVITITVQPEGTIKEGDKVKLICSTNNSDAKITEYEWRKRSKQSWEIVGEDRELRFDRIKENHAGRYACFAVVDSVIESAPAVILNVLFAPKDVKITHITPMDIMEGDSMNLSCKVNRSNPEVTTYAWYINKKKSDNSEKYLFIKEMKTSHSGTYRCKADNIVGSAYSPKFEIDVMYPPKEVKITHHPVNLREGKDMHLTCNYKSSNPPVTNYTWYKENEYLPVQPGKLLKFTNISSEDTGNFSCEAHNDIGSTKSLTLSLKLHDTTTLLAATEALIAIGISVVIAIPFFLLCIIRGKYQRDYPIMQSKEDFYSSMSNNIFKQKRKPEVDIPSSIDTSSVITTKYLQRNF